MELEILSNPQEFGLAHFLLASDANVARYEGIADDFANAATAYDVGLESKRERKVTQTWQRRSFKSSKPQTYVDFEVFLVIRLVQTGDDCINSALATFTKDGVVESRLFAVDHLTTVKSHNQAGFPSGHLK